MSQATSQHYLLVSIWSAYYLQMQVRTNVWFTKRICFYTSHTNINKNCVLVNFIPFKKHVTQIAFSANCKKRIKHFKQNYSFLMSCDCCLENLSAMWHWKKSA